MPFTVLVCVDGSELAESALVEGLAVLREHERTVLVSVVDGPDTSLVMGGSGFAGGVLTGEELAKIQREKIAEAESMLKETATRLGHADAELVVLEGAAGSAICELAETLPASVIVLGTRGRGGLRRAVLGSVSDHVVRHAPCVVLTRNPD
jgi:nucleotide-binding universal stress UspA family protein